MFQTKGDFFSGKFHSVKKGDEFIEKFSPGEISEKLWESHVTYAHIEKVVESAQQGFQVWKKTKLEERITYLKKFQEIIGKRSEEIAMAIALDTGKPLWESKTEAAALGNKVEVTIADSLKRVQNQTIANVMPQISGHTIYKPLGPSLVIGPFNFPCHLANTQIIALLLTGNSVIFKPSEKTIYSSQLMFECLAEANFPVGVINLINGTGKTSSTLAAHPDIKGVFFTGSKNVGLKILEKTHSQIGKLVALELGGKNTTIIHKDAHIEHSLTELIRSCFLSTGQRCTSTSLIAVHHSIQDELMDRFVEISKKILIDHPTKYTIPPFMGPLIDQMAVDKYLDICRLGEEEGAEILIKAENYKGKYDGHYVTPSIYYMKEAKMNSEYLQTEIFGPNCTFIPYKEQEEAIQIANMTEYGLAASVFTHDKNFYEKCILDIDSGLINLNRSTVGASARLPFGGVKSSGNHHPAAVSMIDSCVSMISSLETLDHGSKIDSIIGLKT
ncbi:MAG: aldehyde dehydrogenase family protein [Bacteriovoracaceae bacterium]|nr:aldehyde dehydrogenase family protein [Bacteriovoracaceae bacterium]